MTSAATIAIAREIRENLAGQALTARQAKLYSQRLRRDMGREGLASFGSGDIAGYLEEAMLLLESGWRSEEHTSELQSLMRISYAVFCLKKKNTQYHNIIWKT